jgi:hypothetical protein
MKVTNHQATWTLEQESLLLEMAERGCSSAEIAEALQRTRASVCTRKALLHSTKRLSRSTPQAPAPKTLRKNGKKEAPQERKVPISPNSMNDWKDLVAFAAQESQKRGIRVHITILTFEA